MGGEFGAAFASAAAPYVMNILQNKQQQDSQKLQRTAERLDYLVKEGDADTRTRALAGQIKLEREGLKALKGSKDFIAELMRDDFPDNDPDFQMLVRIAGRRNDKEQRQSAGLSQGFVGPAPPQDLPQPVAAPRAGAPGGGPPSGPPPQVPASLAAEGPSYGSDAGINFGAPNSAAQVEGTGSMSPAAVAGGTGGAPASPSITGFSPVAPSTETVDQRMVSMGGERDALGGYGSGGPQMRQAALSGMLTDKAAAQINAQNDRAALAAGVRSSEGQKTRDAAMERTEKKGEIGKELLRLKADLFPKGKGSGKKGLDVPKAELRLREALADDLLKISRDRDRELYDLEKDARKFDEPLSDTQRQSVIARFTQQEQQVRDAHQELMRAVYTQGSGLQEQGAGAGKGAGAGSQKNGGGQKSTAGPWRWNGLTYTDFSKLPPAGQQAARAKGVAPQ